MDVIKAYFVELVTIMNEMSPYLMLGFLFAGLLHVFMPGDKVVRHMGGRSTKSVINASLLGVPLPLCSCGVIPTGLSFYKDGASKGSTVSFLISTPQTGVDSIMVTYSMLGWPLAVLRPVIAFITGIGGGVLTNFLTRKNTEEEKSFFDPSEKTRKHKNPLVEIFSYAFVDFLQDIAKWLVIGILVAALISLIIPDDFFTSYLTNDYISMLLVLAASVPLYVCATGSVPIAAVLMMKGLSPGAVIVFLMAGPATNVATITMVGKVLGRKALFSYLFSIITGALISGILINEFMPRQWLLGFMDMNHAHHNHEEMIPLWLQITFSVSLVLLIANAFRLKYWPSKQTSENTITVADNMETKTVSVLGMTCNHCKANVENNLRKLPGIKDITVDLQKEQAVIVADKVNLDLVKSTVEGLGYKYGGEK